MNNKDLRSAIINIYTDKDIDPPTNLDSLTKKELIVELDRLNPSTDDPSTDDPSTDDPSTDDVSTDDVSTDDVSTDDVSTDDVSTDVGFVVAKGKSIVCKIGIIGEGKLIKSEYLAGGEKAFKNFIEKGYIVKG